MTRARLNWVTQISALACLVACGSSGNNSLGAGSASSLSANMGGQGAALNVGGSGTSKNGGGANSAGAANNGGANGNAGNGTSGNGTAGNGTSGANTQAGNSGTGSSGSTSDGGSGNGGAGNGGANNGSVGGNAPGGGSSIDVKITGGTGNTVDVGTGGGGNTIDVGTGGGFTIDLGTGGGSTIDLGTGGGSTIDLGTGGGSTIDLGTGGGGTIDLGTGGGGTIDFGCFETALTGVNVYVIKDAMPINADSEGDMWVGGNLITDKYSVGACHTNPTPVAGTTCAQGGSCSNYPLIVGGNISVTGSLVVNGGSGTYVGTAAYGTFGGKPQCGLKHMNPPLPGSVTFATLASDVTNMSIAMSKLTSNCTVTRDSSQALVLTGTDPVLNVCNIDASQLGPVKVNFPTGSSVVVNVTGTSANWASAAVCLNDVCNDSPQSDYVVWNFYQATSLTASGIAIEGTILAPLATLLGDGGHIAGQVIVQYQKSGLEFHPYYFKGCIKWPANL